MDEPRLSVIVVSLGRPDALRRCLRALVQLDYRSFEIVVVADADGLAAAALLPFAGALKFGEFSEHNIARARNLGAALAGGDILAFIDDDAVPEPTWLRALATAFSDSIDAAVGYVRGRNGISFQSRAEAINHLGETVSATPPASAKVPLCPVGFFPKLIGTNMAMRREALRRVGGFDESFRFYLEDSDLSLRFASAGSAVAAVPGAEVHHSFAASTRRSANRVPRSLADVGRSLALFLRKHASLADTAERREWAREEQRRRLVRHMVAGTLEPREVASRLRSFEDGFDEGLVAQFAEQGDIGDVQHFAALPTKFSFHGHTVLSGRSWNRSRLRAAAAREVSNGGRATILSFSPTTFFHQVRFVPDGYWEQIGGLFGRSDRSQPIFRPVSFAARVRAEVRRVAKARGIKENG